jgi:CheY-like chemotaxis protein
MSSPKSPPVSVLLVTDDPQVASGTTALLDQYGCAVWVAEDADSAVELAAIHEPDTALIDMTLPEAQVAAISRRLGRLRGRPGIPIALIRFGNPEDRERSQRAGIPLHLFLPIDPELLLSILAQIRGTPS